MTANEYFTLEDTNKFLDDWCQTIETLKYIEEGPHRTIDSNLMTHSKSCATLCEKSDLGLRCLQLTLSDWFNKDCNENYVKGYLKGMADSMSLTSSVCEKTLEEAKQYYQKRIDPKSVAVGVGVTCGLFVAGKITKSIIEHKTNKQHKENKKESKES